MVDNQTENNNEENRTKIKKRKIYSFLLALFLISPFMINQVWVVTNYFYRSVAIIWVGIESAILGVSLLFIPKRIYALSNQYLYISQPPPVPSKWTVRHHIKRIVISFMFIFSSIAAFYSYFFVSN